MRHGKKFNHLGRTAPHRKAMLANMAASLIEHKRINTTVAKAKALRTYIEPLITKSKNDTTHSRRIVFQYLQNKYAVTELFREISQKVADRPGGYTRIIKTGFRKGDGAEMAMIELVDYNEIYTKEEKKKTTRRRRSAGKAKSQEAETNTKADETPADTAKESKPKAKKEEANTDAPEPKTEQPKAEKDEPKKNESNQENEDSQPNN